MSVELDLIGRTLSSLVLAAALACGMPQAHAASHVAKAVLDVEATVTPSVVINLEHGAAQVSVTPSDIEHGYVELPEGTLLSVDAGLVKPVLMVDFTPSSSAFTSVEVSTEDLHRLIRTSRGADDPSIDNATRLAAASGSDSLTLITYRFRLANDVRPGVYPVPITVDVSL